MLTPVAFASSLTILTGALYLLLFLLAVVWREASRFLVNAQVSRCRRGVATPAGSLGGGFVSTFIAIIVFVWLFGYAWKWLYNALARRTEKVRS